MGLDNPNMRGFNPPWFLPVDQQGDSRILYPHTTTPLDTATITIVNIERGVNALLVQATGQNIRYTLTDQAAPSPTSGFVLRIGDQPLAIPVINLTGMRFACIAEAAGAILEMQQGRLRTF